MLAILFYNVMLKIREVYLSASLSNPRSQALFTSKTGPQTRKRRSILKINSAMDHFSTLLRSSSMLHCVVHISPHCLLTFSYAFNIYLGIFGQSEIASGLSLSILWFHFAWNPMRLSLYSNIVQIFGTQHFFLDYYLASQDQGGKTK